MTKMFHVCTHIHKSIKINAAVLNNIIACRAIRPYSTQQGLSENDVEEIRIPVPWGYLAGKWWGNKNEVPLIGLHGWQDNVNTFNTLAPLLNVSSFFAFDLPGHGMSSYLPPGKIYSLADYIYSLRRVLNHFKWKKYTLMGHSYGSLLGFTQASLFPEEVECFISIDCARTSLIAYSSNMPQFIGRGIDKVLEFEVANNVSAFTFKDAVKLLIGGSLGSVATPEASLHLLKRGAVKHKLDEVEIAQAGNKSDVSFFISFDASTKPKGDKDGEDPMEKNMKEFKALMENVENRLESFTADGMEGFAYKLSRDPRVKINQFSILNEQLIMEFSRHIFCPTLAIRSEQGLLQFRRRYWGPKDRKTFLLIHGWQDNAGSFDKLIPFLSPNYSYLAVDMPGHGLSTHFPKGIFYSPYDAIACIRRIHKHFNWPKISLMGHSLGSIYSFLYSGVYPDDVDVYIAIDGLCPLSVDESVRHCHAKERIQKLLHYDTFDMKLARGYTEREYIEALQKALNTKSEKICKTLMKRGTTECKGALKITRDPRLKCSPPFGFTDNESKQIAERIKCKVLLIRSDDTFAFTSKELYNEVWDMVKTGARYSEFHQISGPHHLHIEKPNLVSVIIKDFLTSAKI